MKKILISSYSVILDTYKLSPCVIPQTHSNVNNSKKKKIHQLILMKIAKYRHIFGVELIFLRMAMSSGV